MSDAEKPAIDLDAAQETADYLRGGDCGAHWQKDGAIHIEALIASVRELQTKYDAMVIRASGYNGRREQAEAERDEALATIERVHAAVNDIPAHEFFSAMGIKAALAPPAYAPNESLTQ